MQKDNLKNDTPTDANNVLADVCQVLVNKKDGIYKITTSCTKKAKYIVKFKWVKTRQNVSSKKCCEQHKKVFIRQLDRDDFAEFVSCENIR